MTASPLRRSTLSRSVVDATGTRRRLQALVATGWPQARLAELAHLRRATVARIVHGQHVTVHAGTARAVAELYDRVWDVPPPLGGHAEKIAAARARHVAGRNRWPPPLAWDDDQLDNPRARPQGWPRRGDNGR